MRGFSLIELMISIAIVGILAAVAVPSYTKYVAEGGRTEAMRELVVIINLEEQYLIENMTYTTDMTELGFDTDPFDSENGRYSIDVTQVANIASDFIASATANTDQAKVDPNCYIIQINHLGQKTAQDTDGNDTSELCWG